MTLIVVDTKYDSDKIKVIPLVDSIALQVSSMDRYIEVYLSPQNVRALCATLEYLEATR